MRSATISISLGLNKGMFGVNNNQFNDCLDEGKMADIVKKEGISFNEDSIDWKPPRGESAKEMMSRLRKFIGQVKDKNMSKILIVTHGELIQCLRFIMRNLPNDRYSEWINMRGDVGNCQIYQFRFNQDGVVQETSYILDGGDYISN